MKTTVEICCGSYYDAKQAALGGAKRIELNSALMLGGLTPTVSTLKLVKNELPLKVIAMVRPRGAGFCYLDEEFQVMEAECQMLLEHGADGIAFGCLQPDGTLDQEKNRRLTERIKGNGKEAVFHRAFDCCQDPMKTIEELIRMGVDRVLTSGLKSRAVDGCDMIQKLQSRYGSRIQILAGSGVNASNASKLLQATGINQIHSSCRDWLQDATTVGNDVSYSIASGEYELCYDVVSAKLVRKLLESISNCS